MKVSPTQVHAFLEAVAMSGAKPDELLRIANFDAARLDSGAPWIDLDEFDRLIGLGLALTRDPALGLHWGERASMMRFGVVAPLMANSRTMRAAIAAMMRYSRTLSDRSTFRLEESENVAVLICERPTVTFEQRHVIAELAIVGFLRLVQYFGGGDAMPKRVFVGSPGTELEFAL